METVNKEIENLREALRLAADRFEDLGKAIDEHGSYDNAGFMYATAIRCRKAMQGGTFNG